MNIIVTERTATGGIAKAQSADGRFAWFHGQEDWLRDTVAGKSIYQMRWMRTEEMGSDPLPEEDRQLVLAFWAALEAAQQQPASDEAEGRDAPTEAAPRYRPEVVGAERQRQQKNYDETQNEGGEGFNPWRDL